MFAALYLLGKNCMELLKALSIPHSGQIVDLFVSFFFFGGGAGQNKNTNYISNLLTYCVSCRVILNFQGSHQITFAVPVFFCSLLKSISN